VEDAAKKYAASFVDSLVVAVQGVRSGNLATKAAVTAAILAAHVPARDEWTRALDDAFAPYMDPTGKIIDAEGAARVLEAAAQSMRNWNG
jgi:hypothetical protein